MNEFRQWFASQPFTTKWLTVLSLIFPLLLKFGILSWHWVVWEWVHLSHKLQVHNQSTIHSIILKVMENVYTNLFDKSQS